MSAADATAKQRWQEENRERSNEIKQRYVERHPERVEQAKRRYVERNRAKAQESKRRWAAANREKRYAQGRLDKALKAGRIVRPLFCEGCAKGGALHGHHDDYSRPLDVRWLCPRCHKATHMGAAA